MIVSVLIGAVLACCSGEETLRPDEPAGDGGTGFVDGDKIVLTVDLQVPEMPETRGLTGTPDYNDMHLYAVEFADNGSPLTNTLIGAYEAEEETPQSDRVVYKLTLRATMQPRVLHLIALPKGEKLEVEYGLEATVMPMLKTGNGVAAYWRRLTFAAGYVTTDGEGNMVANDDVQKLRHVALVRNYAQVSMESRASNFVLTGFAIVNNPAQGTIAPWDEAQAEFPELLDGAQKMKPYQTVWPGYKGIVPAATSLNNPDNAPVLGNDVGPKFMYERPYDNAHHTFLLIKGYYNGSKSESYYKLDIGKMNEKGVFEKYDLLRNYRYDIVLNSVASAGESSVEAALSSYTANNFSFDVVMKDLLNISNGDEVVYVNFTTEVITDDSEREVPFKFRYRDLTASKPTYNNDNVNFIGLEPGAVIKSVDMGTTDDASGWRTVTITCRAATAETRVQKFTVVKENGLGREITLILHKKWKFENMRVYAGLYTNWTPGMVQATETGVPVGAAQGSTLTVFFDMPDQMDEAIFPLPFVIESKQQNIENFISTGGADAAMTAHMVVQTGPSLFDDFNMPRIQYVKTVSLERYRDPMSSGGVMIEENGRKIHRVACRFETIMPLSVGNDNLTTVRISNPNYEEGEVTFYRK